MRDLEQIGQSVAAQLAGALDDARMESYEQGYKIGLSVGEADRRREYDRGFNDGITQEREQHRGDAERDRRGRIERYLYSFFGCSANALDPSVRTQVKIAATNIAKAVEENNG